MNDLTTTGNPTRSWFDKPEGKVGGIALVVLIGVLGFGFVQALPFLVAAAASTLHLMLMLIAIGAIAMLFLHPASRNFLFTLYKVIFKLLTGMVITLDPLLILQDYIEQLKNNLVMMKEQIDKVKKTIYKLTEKINKYSAEATQMKQRAEAGLKRGGDFQKTAIVENRAAERRLKAIAKLTNLKNKITMIDKVLKKMYDNCEIMVMDKTDEINMTKDEWEAIKAASGAIKSAMSIINGGGDERANFEQAMEFIVDDIALKMGEMENFMDMTQNLMNSIDLDNDMCDEKLLKDFETVFSQTDSWLLGDLNKDGVVDEQEKSTAATQKISLFN